MTERRCDLCTFWTLLTWHDQSGSHPDDRHGKCCRSPPPASLGGAEYHLRQLVWIIARHYVGDEADEIALLAEWEEAEEESSRWPTTCGNDWCGEWSPAEYGPPN